MKLDFLNKLVMDMRPVKIAIVLLLFCASVNAQDSKFALMKMGQYFIGVTDNADKQTFNFTTGFFPNDYNIISDRGQHGDANNGSGFRLGVVRYWFNPYTNLQDTIPIYGPVSEFNPSGTIINPLTNYIRYRYPQQVIEFNDVELEDFGTYDPAQFGDETFDQVVTSTVEYIYGIQMHRKVMSWSQQYNDNYIIFDVEFENKSDDTFDSLYISMQNNQQNTHMSYGRNPIIPASERYNNRITWQHYYGAEVGDSLRVFYEYSADDPDQSGDNMGAPVISQQGRLAGPDIFFRTVLHASQEPYTNEAADVDDFTQPKITYMGNANNIPSNQGGEDQFGSTNAWALVGGYSDYFPKQGNVWPGTHHGGNNDEIGVSDFSQFPAGTKTSINCKMYTVFGPYHMEPGQKVRIVYAVGFDGIGIKKGKEVGLKWLRNTLEEPPALPDPEKGYFPANFAYPVGATEMDKRKDRWISTGIDSVMKTAYRAKWNFDHGYKIPLAPPPPEELSVLGLGEGVEIKWKASEAESRDNFAGYRIMRRVSNADTVYYQPVYESDANDVGIEHTYYDKDVLFGAVYYYYVQSKAKIDENDLNADPTSRGKMMYSSRLLVPNIDNVNPPRPSSDDMSKIRIVPNPYNINDPLLDAYGYTDQRGLNFFNLPGIVTIKIFTENGDLIQTIVHDDPSESGLYTWNMITSSQQVINSGIYIAVFEKPNGEISYQKFIVVR